MRIDAERDICLSRHHAIDDFEIISRYRRVGWDVPPLVVVPECLESKGFHLSDLFLCVGCECVETHAFAPRRDCSFDPVPGQDNKILHPHCEVGSCQSHVVWNLLFLRWCQLPVHGAGTVNSPRHEVTGQLVQWGWEVVPQLSYQFRDGGPNAPENLVDDADMILTLIGSRAGAKALLVLRWSHTYKP